MRLAAVFPEQKRPHALGRVGRERVSAIEHHAILAQAVQIGRDRARAAGRALALAQRVDC